MIRSASTVTLAVCSCLVAYPLFAAGPPAASAPGGTPSAGTPAAVAKPAGKCLGDVRAFNAQMSKEGYWLGGSGYGYGYPVGMYGYGAGMPLGSAPAGNAAGYGTARPGYEIRTLTASATILGRMGQEQPCQTVLATTRTIYKRYAADLRDRGINTADQPGWQQRQIAAAQPVTGKDVAFRSDQMVDTDVLNPRDETLGSVHDLVMSPQTGKIAYLIIARGGLFGIDASYVPVPWENFKATPDASLLVLDTTRAAMSAAPQVTDNQFTKTGHFNQESQKVDAYWTAHIKTGSETK